VQCESSRFRRRELFAESTQSVSVQGASKKTQFLKQGLGDIYVSQLWSTHVHLIERTSEKHKCIHILAITFDILDFWQVITPVLAELRIVLQLSRRFGELAITNGIH
jgi:hypothetical protein